MTTSELHGKAIDCADIAFIKHLRGENKIDIPEFADAFLLEKEAALQCIKDGIGEPTQSVLLRSAASLAINCGKYRDAEQLISIALSYDPPNEIAEELRDLWEEVNFERHLRLKGISLNDNELQLSIAGNSVGYGLVKSKEIWDRISTFEKLTYRTIERKQNLPFREGQFPKRTKDKFVYYISAARAASFAFTIRLGEQISQQLEIPGTNFTMSVIDDLIENISLLNQADDAKLKKKIVDPVYYRNFVMLSKELAPDGDEVNLVGITVIRNGVENQTQLTRKKVDFVNSIVFANDEVPSEDEYEPYSLSGILTFADSGKNKIKLLLDDNKSSHDIIVPKGLGDIVRSYWEERVSILCIKKSSGLELIDLESDKSV